MRHRLPVVILAGIAVLSSAIIFMSGPDSTAATSGRNQSATSDALYQPAPFGGLASFATANVAYNYPVVGMASTADGGGYWLVASDGGVFAFGDAGFYGAATSLHLNQPVVGMVATHDGRGYWLAAADGGVFSYGDAESYGSMCALHLNEPIVGMAATSDGHGYWLVGADGGVFAFGDAQFYGSTGGAHLNQPVVGMAATSVGYWLVAADGGVFAFGNAPFSGSLGGHRLVAPIVAIAGAPQGNGYWLAGSDGGVFAFGTATFHGSLGDHPIAYPISDITIDPGGSGYWLLPITNLPTVTLGAWTGIEPGLMQFSGDAGNIVTNIVWSSWNDLGAVGKGSWQYDNCLPDCAGGTVTPTPATIILGLPSDGRFTQLTEELSGPFGGTSTFALPNATFRASS